MRNHISGQDDNNDKVEILDYCNMPLQEAASEDYSETTAGVNCIGLLLKGESCSTR